MGAQSVRRRLVTSFVTILALFAINQAIDVWGDRTRGHAIAALDVAQHRLVLIANVHQRLADLHKEVTLLSEVRLEPGSLPNPTTRLGFEESVTRLGDILRELKALDPTGDRTLAELEDVFNQTAKLWRKFYEYQGVEQGWSVAYLARADPLVQRLLKQLLPRLEAQGEQAALRARAQSEVVRQRTRMVTLLIFIASVTIGIVVAIRISRHLVRRLAELGRGADLIGEVNLKHRIPIEPRDELGALAEHFNEMAAHLDVAQTRLNHANAELAQLNMVLSRTVEEELAKVQLAGRMQRELLPHAAPVVAGYDLAGKSIPAQTVGGDYFDFVFIDDRRLAMCLGDVSGKGLPASLLMANLQASIRSQVLAHASVPDCLRRTNTLLFRSTNAHTFVTAFYCTLDPDRHELCYSNAGHNPPLLFRAGGAVERLERGGLVLGIREDFEFQEAISRLRPQDLLVIYSDGVSEMEDAAGREFGEEGIIDVVNRERERSAAEILEAIVIATFEFGGDQLQPDDITLIVLKRS